LNRMRSPIPAFWRKASGWPFLLALLLACPQLQTAAKAMPPKHIAGLDTEEAAKLLIHVAKPPYPAIAKVNFVQGIVKLEIRVAPDGQVSEAHVLDGQPILAVAALDAVRKWLYRPYLLQGTPVSFTTDVMVRFNLHPHFYRGQMPKDADVYLEKQVHPPEVITHPQEAAPHSSLRMKVLVGSNGEVVDANSLEATNGSGTDLARRSLDSWKFRPARWGSIAIPWYITVEVPLRDPALDQAANAAKH
jgi:TonB family protein